MLYQLNQLIQSFNGTTVLDIEQLTIEAGKIYALLGPNGAGKSTLLNILAFLDRPASGSLTFLGKQVGQQDDLPRLRREVVLVDQHPIMFSTTVSENIAFGLKIRKIEKNQRQRLIGEALETVGLERYREARAHELSGGETQRLALARAIALRPKVLLCDEPTASVDAENQAIISDLLAQINRDFGTSVIFTTHDRLQAATLAQHTLVLENGRLTNSTYENSYTCTVAPLNNGTWRCLLQKTVELILPSATLNIPPALSGRLAIHPGKIQLYPCQEADITDNGIQGSVVQLMAEGEYIRVVVHIGVLMVVLMQAAAYQHSALRIGSQVRLEIPAEACCFSG